MFIVIVVMAGMVLFTALAVGVLPLFDIFHSNNSQVVAGEIAAIQRVVSDTAADDLAYFYREGYAIPSAGGKIDVNSAEHRDLYFMNYQRYQYTKPNIKFKSDEGSDGVWSHRFAMWFESPFGNFLGSDYTKDGFNKCGVGTVETAEVWCGDTKSLWAKLESKNSHYGLIQSEQQRLYRLSRKFYRYYEETGDFESLVSPLVAPAKGAIASVAIHAVNGSSPTNMSECAGIYNLKGVPLGCNDMFNAWGKPIYLHVLSSDHIAFTNSLGIEIVQAAGLARKYVGLAEEININRILEP